MSALGRGAESFPFFCLTNNRQDAEWEDGIETAVYWCHRISHQTPLINPDSPLSSILSIHPPRCPSIKKKKTEAESAALLKIQLNSQRSSISLVTPDPVWWFHTSHRDMPQAMATEEEDMAFVEKTLATCTNYCHNYYRSPKTDLSSRSEWLFTVTVSNTNLHALIENKWWYKQSYSHNGSHGKTSWHALYCWHATCKAVRRSHDIYVKI